MTAIPFGYNVQSVRARWPSAAVAVLGIAGTVAVFVAMLALARGFKATLVSSGSPGNVIVRRAGSASEMDSVLTIEQVRAIEDAAEVARENGIPMVSPEVVVVGSLPLRRTGTDANVQFRGVSPRALAVHPGVRISAGRFFTPSLHEAVVGKNALLAYSGLSLGGKISYGGAEWTIVGIMDAGGSSFDSEMWCDSAVLNVAYNRPAAIYQSLTAHLVSPDGLDALKKRLAADPRLNVQVERETEYYEKASQMLTTLIVTLGSLIALVMGVGAVLGALNTMYSAVAARSREIATLRALGFGGGAVLVSFIAESLFVAGLGGVLGGLAALPLNGITTGTMNWQTFSHLAFAFQVTPLALLAGLGFALAMGLVGGVPPAIRAVRSPVAEALRGL
jgi:putative ABC transport system permease protein